MFSHDLVAIIKEVFTRWLGHLGSMSQCRIPKNITSTTWNGGNERQTQLDRWR